MTKAPKEVEIMFDDGSSHGGSDDGDENGSRGSAGVGICYPDEGDTSPQVIAWWDTEDLEPAEQQDIRQSLTPDDDDDDDEPVVYTRTAVCDPCSPRGGKARKFLLGVYGVCILYLLIAMVRHPERGQFREFYHTRGTDIIGPNNKPFLAKGMVLTGWLVPDASELRLNDVHPRDLNAPTDITTNVERLLANTDDADAFWEAFHANYVTSQDIASLAKQGFNAVRIPFNYRLVSPDGTPGKYSKKGFQVLDKAIKWCKNNKLAVLLDMHATPGGQSYAPDADPEYYYWYQDPEHQNKWEERGVPVLWEHNDDYHQKTSRTPEFNRQRTADIWKEIAHHYRNEAAILGYELVNAPNFYEGDDMSTANLRAFYMTITQAVREVDTNHIIFVEGNQFGESIDGLLPPWDSNMAIAIHRYWHETAVDSQVQAYLDARQEHEVPIVLTEAGDNSNPWLYEMAHMMQDNKIGWFFKGYKRVQSITAWQNVKITPDYQYVIDNWRDSPDLDHKRAKKGLMDLAQAVKTENCDPQPGFLKALLDDKFGSTSQAVKENTLPGLVQAVDFDLGNQGIAYSDSKYKEEQDKKASWNGGWVYRNDGVDIYPSNDTGEWSNGYHISDTVDGEWIKYTVQVKETAFYRASFRLQPSPSSSSDGEFQLLDGGVVLADAVQVENANIGKWASGNWHTQTVFDAFQLTAGEHSLKLKVVKGGFDLAWMHFEQVQQQDI